MTEIEIKNKDIKFSYRGTDLSDDLTVSAKSKDHHAKKRHRKNKSK